MDTIQTEQISPTLQTEQISPTFQEFQKNINSSVQYDNKNSEIQVLISALSAQVSLDNQLELINGLSAYPESIEIARSLDNSRLVRQLRIQSRSSNPKMRWEELTLQKERVFYKNQNIGKTLLLYKHSLPGELQAKLAYESAIDRYLEYLQKKCKIAILHETDYHVKVFIPIQENLKELENLWGKFIKEIAFSKNDNFQQTLSNLQQTFILMLKSVTLSDRGFSTLEVPIITQDQAIVLASFYLAIVEQVRERQNYRQLQIDNLNKQIENENLTAKERSSKEKELQKKQEMQEKEAKKYQEYFQKSLAKILQEQQSYWKEIEDIESQFNQAGSKKSQFNKLRKQQEKLQSKIIFGLESITVKEKLFVESQGNPFEFIALNIKQDPKKFKEIIEIAKLFNKSATEQINSTRGDIFTQCIVEMYRLLEITQFDEIPESLLTSKPKPYEMRLAGDDGKDFCYSCGIALDENNAKWKVARFMFESPSQRRQSSSSEDRPFICSCCSILSFASPLKVTDDSIILRLEFKANNLNNDSKIKQLKLKDYLRGLVTGEMDIISGKYIILNSQNDKSSKGELASKKLGLQQYALAKIASRFPIEVLSDWTFNLYLQASQPTLLENRQLILTKGLIEGYNLSIITKGNKGQEVNLKLGDAIRYAQQDLPYLAEYTSLKAFVALDYPLTFQDKIKLENIRELYYEIIKQDLNNQRILKGDTSMSETQLSKRAKICEDVAALTGLLYPFVEYAEYLIKIDKEAEEKRKQGKKEEDQLDPATIEKIKKDVAREVSKIIENVKDEHFFTYYASIGDQKRTSIRATLKRDRDTYFIYDQAKKLLLDTLQISDLQENEENGKSCLKLTLADVENAFHYFASDPLYSDNQGDKKWNDLTYRLKLSLYTRFPELVRKLSSTSKGDK